MTFGGLPDRPVVFSGDLGRYDRPILLGPTERLLLPQTDSFYVTSGNVVSSFNEGVSPLTFVWQQNSHRGQLRYRVNRAHPTITAALSGALAGAAGAGVCACV